MLMHDIDGGNTIIICFILLIYNKDVDDTMCVCVCVCVRVCVCVCVIVREVVIRSVQCIKPIIVNINL